MRAKLSRGHPVKNKYKVPKKMWNKWGSSSQRIFNEMMYAMRPRVQFMFLHPDATAAPHKHWDVIRYNAAWTAAQALRSKQ